MTYYQPLWKCCKWSLWIHRWPRPLQIRDWISSRPQLGWSLAWRSAVFPWNSLQKCDDFGGCVRGRPILGTCIDTVWWRVWSKTSNKDGSEVRLDLFCGAGRYATMLSIYRLSLNQGHPLENLSRSPTLLSCTVDVAVAGTFWSFAVKKSGKLLAI